MQDYDSTQKAKREAKQRDGYSCQFCGVTREQHREAFGEDVHAHHIVRSSAGGSDNPRNLITVCRDCHNILERTQADAVDRIAKQSMKSTSEMTQLREENERLRERVDDLCKSIHRLERILRDEEMFSSAAGKTTVYGEVVVSKIGTRTVVTADSEKASDAYRDWGTKMERVSMSAYEGEKIAENITDQINRKRERDSL